MLKLKSLKESPSSDDGIRIMIARYGLRYQKREDREWDQWWKELAPSPDLHRKYIKQRFIAWEEYVNRWKNEIRNRPEALEAIARLKKLSNEGRTVTLLCHCIDEKHCHRTLVKQMVET